MASTRTRVPSVGLVAVPHPRVAMDVTDERLRPVVHHLHRTAGVQGEQAQVDLQADVLARAECPTDARHVKANLVGPQAEGGDHLFVVDVQPLGGDVEVDPADSVGNRQARLGTELSLVLHPDLVVALDHHLAVGLLVAAGDVEDTEGLTARSASSGSTSGSSTS